MWDTVTKEVVGINVPKIVMTRSDTEQKDVAISEIGNTMAFGVGGLLVDQVLKRSFAGVQKAGASQTAQRWASLGRSLGVYSTVFSLMWAMPFIRNYITAKQTGSVSFADVIKANHHHPENSHDRQAVLKDALSYYQGQAQAILGLGALGTVASAGFARLAAQKEIWAKPLEKLFQHQWMDSLLLKGGKFAGFGGTPALLFWGLPAYGGWIHASRDPYETKEQWLKFINFVACFFGPPVVIDKLFKGKFNSRFPQLKDVGFGYEAITKTLDAHPEKKATALKLWAGKNALSLFSSIALLGTLPQLINWYLTQERMRRDQARQGQTPTTGQVGSAERLAAKGADGAPFVYSTASVSQISGTDAPGQPSNRQSIYAGYSMKAQAPQAFWPPALAQGVYSAPASPSWNPSAFSATMNLPAHPLNPS